METKTQRRRHVWTEAELERLMQVVEVDLKGAFAAAAPGEVHYVWAQVPGRLGMMVTAAAAERQYTTLAEKRKIRESAAAERAASSSTAPVDFRPVADAIELLRMTVEDHSTDAKKQLTALRSSVETLCDELGRIEKIAARLVAALDADLAKAKSP